MERVLRRTPDIGVYIPSALMLSGPFCYGMAGTKFAGGVMQVGTKALCGLQPSRKAYHNFVNFLSSHTASPLRQLSLLHQLTDLSRFSDISISIPDESFSFMEHLFAVLGPCLNL